ncbi:MAG: HEAT repeat domain-containing protein [Gracilimonas sp.]|nr:HEAT repeat domain-containing protein [Gracilimonas sp.]
MNATYTIPTELELVSHGTKVTDELSSVDQKTVQWDSGEKIPVTGLTFSLGNYETISARAGVKQVNLYANENALLPEVREGLLDIAVSAFKNYEQKVSLEFPYRSLNIVVLPDHHWEEVHSGAGVIYLYQNLGSLATQLRRGIAEQWFGNYHRYLNTTDNRYEFIKVLLAGSNNTEQLKNEDDLQSIHRWNIWESGVNYINEQYMKEVIEGSFADMLRQLEGVTGWEDYADIWYDKTGYYWAALPQPEVTEREEKIVSDNDLIYNVDYVYDELNGSLMLVFEAEGIPIETLVSIEATAYSFTDTTKTEFTFTGSEDTVGVNLNSGIDYMTIRTPEHPDLVLNETKPFMFWISQLRDKDPENRAQAAKALQAFSDNPDLQLALRDVMGQEQNEDVRAAMLETLSSITKDATGTEETFIGYVNSENVATQLSGLKALANYEGNESAAYTVRNKLIRTDVDTVFNTGLRSYVQIAPLTDLISLAERFQSSGEDDMKALKTLKTVIADDTTGSALQVTDRYALGNLIQ